VVENIVNVNSSKKVQDSISNGLLTVINSDMLYQENASSRDILNFFHSALSTIQKNLQDKAKGTMILSAPDPYFNRGKYDVSRVFEEEVGKELPENVGLL
jgi:hypothetical protein